MPELYGWDNEKRNDLAKQFTPKLPDDGKFHDDAIDACGKASQPA